MGHAGQEADTRNQDHGRREPRLSTVARRQRRRSHDRLLRLQEFRRRREIELAMLLRDEAGPMNLDRACQGGYVGLQNLASSDPRAHAPRPICLRHLGLPDVFRYTRGQMPIPEVEPVA
jgi:hypothetical protein